VSVSGLAKLSYDLVMRTVLFLLILLFAGSFNLQAQITTAHGEWKLIHARATQTKQKVQITIQAPSREEVVTGPDVTVRFATKNWPLEKNNKHLHFILDNDPFQSHFSSDPFVFRNVKPGIHVIRIFPVYPWHESVKQPDALAFVKFYVQEKKGSSSLDFSQPMMIYSTPVGDHASNERLPGQPHSGILIDWFLHNVNVGSKAGYFVRLSIDGKELMSMKEWRPHYIQGLKAGEHRIKLELVKNGVPVTGNVTERTIRVR
jgi:hypothetical protein